MKNWSTDVSKLQQDPEKYAIWKIEQMVNFGLDGERISTILLKKYWTKLTLDPDKKKSLEFLLNA